MMDRKEYGAYLLAGILAAFLVFVRQSMSLGSWDELVVVCFTIVFVLVARWVFFPQLRAEGYFPLIYVGLLGVVGAALSWRPLCVSPGRPPFVISWPGQAKSSWPSSDTWAILPCRTGWTLSGSRK